MKNQKLAQALIAAAFALAAAPLAIAQTQGVSRTEIVIGTEQDLSGPIVAFSKQLKNGMEMRVEEINAARRGVTLSCCIFCVSYLS